MARPFLHFKIKKVQWKTTIPTRSQDPSNGSTRNVALVFIVQDSGEEDIFVHVADCGGVHLTEGQKVAYKTKMIQKPDGSTKPGAAEVKVKGIRAAVAGAFPFAAYQPMYGFAPYAAAAGFAAPLMAAGARPIPGQLQTGSVKWFNVAKGFGFIIPSIGGDELFVSSKSVKSPPSGHLNENDLVEYTVGTSPEGKAWATNVIVRGLGVPSNGVGQKRKGMEGLDLGLGLKHARQEYDMSYVAQQYAVAPQAYLQAPQDNYYAAAPAVPAYAGYADQGYAAAGWV